MRRRSPRMAVALAAALLPLALAAQPIIYPAKGQSPQQQQKDEGQCYSWAKQSTGIDPAAVAQSQGPAVGGGERLRGAAVGALIGSAGDNAGGGAVLGAMVGGHRARRNQAAAKSSTIDTFNRAVGACMESRGYTVR